MTERRNNFYEKQMNIEASDVCKITTHFGNRCTQNWFKPFPLQPQVCQSNGMNTQPPQPHSPSPTFSLIATFERDTVLSRE
jgi:hypothetical protein